MRRPLPLFLLLSTCAVLAAVTILLGAWIDDHRLPVDWDDCAHIHQVFHDAHAFQNDGPVGLARALWGQKRYAPPGYRLLALPVSLTFGPDVVYLKIWLLLNLLAIFALLARGAWLLADEEDRPGAACLTLLAITVSPILLRAGMRLYTEPALYLGTAVATYFLVRMVLRETPHWSDVVGLGCGLAAGSLAKLTFAGVLGPMMLTACVLSLARRPPTLSFRRLMAATGLATLLIGPLYLMNFKAYLSYASGVTRQGAVPSLGRMFTHFFAGLTGPAQSVFFVAVLLALALHAFRRREFTLGFDGRRGAALLILAAGFLPMVLMQFAAHHVNIKYSTPSYMVGTVALGVLAARLGFSRGPLVAIPVLGAAAQIALLVWPWLGLPGLGRPTQEMREDYLLREALSVAQRMDQWNWEGVYGIAEEQKALFGATQARIAYLGYGRAFNRKQIEFPWIVREERVDIDELFTTDHVPRPAEEIDKILAGSHIVMTIPFYTFGEFGHRNLANADLVAKLDADPRFAGPEILRFGDADFEQVYLYRRFKPAAVDPAADLF